jgi:tripartite-type tricarboxylate transporter receptor subunit TctC
MRKPMRNYLLFVLALGMVGSACQPNGHGTGSADSYPTRMVSVICPWAPGGGSDEIARYWAGALERELGKPFVVVNRTGGSGAVGHTAGAKARPDGYTLTLITFELSTMHRMGICPLTYEDFSCILQMNGDAAAILVRADSPWESLGDLLDHIRRNPGAVKMSGTATGGAWDLARAGLQLAAEIPVESVVWVPTKGAAPSLVELLGGHIDAVCCSVPEAATQIEGGHLRALAVMSEQRLEEFPEVPTAREQGVDWVAVGWRGLAAPKGTPPELIDRLVDKCREIAESEDYRKFMKGFGYAIQVRLGDEFREFLAEQDAMWKQVVEAAGYAQ